MEELGLTMNLKELGVTEDMIPGSADSTLIMDGGYKVPDKDEIREILSTPYDYIESKDFFSWERYFTALLIEKTKGSYLAYSKKKLNTRYLNDKIKAAVLLKMEKIVLS